MSYSAIDTAIAFRRFVAAGCALLLLTITCLAASPDAHRHLHDDADHADHECAIVLFAQGFALALGALLVSAPRLIGHASTLLARTELRLIAPRYLHQPERGPPVS